MNVTATITSLSAKNLGEVQIPLPSARELDTIARLVEASEATYTASLEAAQLRRETLRDSIIQQIGSRAGS